MALANVESEQYYLMAGATLLVSIFLFLRAAMFLSGSAHAEGEVIDVQAVETTCGKGSPPCTKFFIVVGWAADGQELETTIEVDQVDGHRQPMSSAGYTIGDAVPLLYDPDDVTAVYREGKRDLWHWPVITLFIAGVLAAIGMAGRVKLW